jgi:hypothetical protein
MNYQKTKKLISLLRVKSQAEEGKLVPFVLYPEQERLLQMICENDKVIVCKGRQIGASTLAMAYATVYALSHKNTDIAIATHVFQSTSEMRNKIKENLAIFDQGTNTLVTRDVPKEIVLANGSRFIFLTAESGSAGRGFTFGLVVLSEAAYYKNSTEFVSSILGAAQGAQIIMESTAFAGDSHYRSTWEGEKFTKFFSPLESHPNYRQDPDAIDDRLWEELAATYGFTDRSVASWWYHEALHTRCGGNEFKAAQDYPVSPEHAFTKAQGRWIPLDPKIRPYIIDPDTKVKVFAEPRQDWTGRYVMAVDTSAGGGGDYSVILVWDCFKSEIAAMWSDNFTLVDAFADKIKQVYAVYKPKHIIIEGNGVGSGPIAICRSAHLPVLEYTAKSKDSNGKTVYAGFLWARQMIMNGLTGDEHLAENCRSCVIKTPKPGHYDFTGSKDVIAALSFLGNHQEIINKIANEPQPRVVPAGAFDAEKHKKSVIKAKKNKGIGSWTAL